MRAKNKEEGGLEKSKEKWFFCIATSMASLCNQFTKIHQSSFRLQLKDFVQSVIRSKEFNFQNRIWGSDFRYKSTLFFSFFLEKLFLTYIELEAKEKVLQIMLCFHFRSICLLMLKRQRNTASRSWYKPFFVMSSFFAVKEQKTTSSLRRKCDPFLQFWTPNALLLTTLWTIGSSIAYVL